MRISLRRPSGLSLPLLGGLIIVAAIGWPLPVSAATPTAASYLLDATYDVAVHLDWDTRRVAVRTTIEIVNATGSPVDRIDLNSVAAKLGDLKALRTRIDGRDVAARVSGQTIRVLPGQPIADGDQVTLWVAFRARLRASSRSRDYFFAKIGGIAQLYRFIPWVSRRIPFANDGHGEPFLTPNSHRARVALSADRPLVWATSGRRVARQGRKTTFFARDVRDFSLTASPSYRSVSGRSRDGDTRIFAHTRTLDGRRLIRLARTELARYEAFTGIEYPHPTYRIAETGGGLAMEAPGLIWIPRTRSAADQPFLVSHETAHQWFYGIVGNDQSTNAFADEALADYFSRRARGTLRASRCRQDRLDRTIRGYSNRCYFEVIYVQGARFLDKLRRDFGGQAFRRAIRAYAHEYRNGIGSNARLLEAFRAEMGNAVLPRFRKRFPSLY